MDKCSRMILLMAGLLGLLAVLFPPFRQSNGQPTWGYLGSPPGVADWITWEEILPGHLRPAGIHWICLGLEAMAIGVLALTIWASMQDNGHHHRR